MILKLIGISATIFALSACASGAPEPGPRGPAAGINQSEQLLSRARKMKAERGCAEAAPTYRVIASFGEGYEVGQYELGDCLLTMTGAHDAEKALFRDEGLLWLRRAAWAGNARAQFRLATALSGGPVHQVTGVASKPIEAMGWALVYEKNSAHKLYGLAPVHPQNMAHLNAALLGPDKEAAEAFAAGYKELKMTGFEPPANQGGREGRSGPRGGPDGGDQQRRRRR